MVGIRFRTRHVHQSLARYLESELDSKGWVTPPINFRERPITFLEFEPQEAGLSIEPNTVSITLGDEGPDEPQEMGASVGGVWQVEYPVFVDIYGSNASITASIAGDVKCILGDLTIPVLDYYVDPLGVDTLERIYIERETVVIERPPVSLAVNDFRRFWRTTKATVSVRFA